MKNIPKLSKRIQHVKQFDTICSVFIKQYQSRPTVTHFQSRSFPTFFVFQHKTISTNNPAGLVLWPSVNSPRTQNNEDHCENYDYTR